MSVIIYPTAFLVTTKARADGKAIRTRRQVVLSKESWATEGVTGAIPGQPIMRSRERKEIIVRLY